MSLTRTGTDAERRAPTPSHPPRSAVATEDFRPWGPPLRVRVLVMANFALASLYLMWWFSSGHVGSTPLFVMLAVAEGFSMLHLLGLWFALWATRVDPPPARRTSFSIDVLVPTRGEPLEILERTVAAAVRMAIPHRTYVLDDVDRAEVLRLARRLGAEYIARPATARTGAKAGNLNHGLARTGGELVVVFDADHVPRKDFLRRIIGYFEDPDVAFVQTPQYYANAAENDVARGAYQQQALFYGPICRGKNGLGAAFCCGTNVVFRRAALDEVGGFDEHSVVEDFVTSMRIHRLGWSSVYYPYILAEGLGPGSIRAYFRQQFRWARGSIGALTALEPFRRGYSFGQRFQHLLATTFYLVGLVTVIYILLPILYLVFGISAFSTESGTFALFYAPYLIVALITLRWGLGGQLRLEHLRFTFGSFPVYSLAGLAALLHIPARFRVTAKTADGAERPHVLAWVTVLAAGATLGAIVAGVLFRPLDATTTTNIAWAIVNLLLLQGVVRATLREAVLAPRARAGRSARVPAVLENGHRSGQPAAATAALLTRGEVLLPEHAVPPPSVEPFWRRMEVGRATVEVTALTVLGLVLRLVLIDAQSLRLDESLSLGQVQRYSLWGLWEYFFSSNVHVPLFHTIMWFWVRVAGDSEWVLRIPSVIFGTAAIPLLYAVGRRLIGPRAALFAAAIGAASPFWVWHSAEARMYPLVLFLSLASLVLLFRAVERGSARGWVAYAAVTALSLYSHYFAILMLPVHLAYLLLERVDRRTLVRWLLAAVGIGALFAPWGLVLYFNRIQGGGVASITNGVRLGPSDFTIFGVLYGFLYFVLVYVGGYAQAIGQGVGIMGALTRIAVGSWPLLALRGAMSRRFTERRSRSAVWFLGAWILLTMGVVFALNVWKPGLWLQRYLIITSPAVFLGLAAALSRVIRFRVAGLVVVFVAFAGLTVVDNLSTGNPMREDFRASVEWMNERFEDDDVLLVLPPFAATPVRYYFERDHAVLELYDPTPVLTEVVLPDLARRHAGATLWVLVDQLYQNPVDPDVDPEVLSYLDWAFEPVDTRQFGRMEIRRYRL
jgi:cellulose synthase (UDP-forming)